MRCKFMGKNRSMGLINGAFYDVETKIIKYMFRKSYIVATISDNLLGNTSIVCNYSTLENFMSNWKLKEIERCEND